MIGIVCLILELKMPGVGVPGVIAAVCFVLFFWSHSQSAGLDLLAVLLFVLGLVLIGLEIFVFPGIGVAGVSGVLLVVFSLALVALEKRPQTSEDWVGLLAMMAQFGLALIGAVLLAVLLVSYLPHIPYLNRLMLKPQADAEAAGDDLPEAVRPEMAALLGAIGVAATPLRPAGKVKFGDEYIDVVAEGAYVEAGHPRAGRRDRREPGRGERSVCEAFSRWPSGRRVAPPRGPRLNGNRAWTKQQPDPGLRPDRRGLPAVGGGVVLHQRHAAGAGADRHRRRRRPGVLPRQHDGRVHPARRPVALPVFGGLLARYWPKTRFGRRMLLTAPDEDATVAAMPVNLELEQLRGRFGRASPTCGRPASATSTAGAWIPSPRG